MAHKKDMVAAVLPSIWNKSIIFTDWKNDSYSMKGIQDTSTNYFGAIIKEADKYVVPKFQRDYSWDKDQWDDLWNDIESALAEEEGEHYMGYLVLQKTGVNIRNIIDGQQRFTTITLLILAAIKLVKALAEKGVDKEENEERWKEMMNTYIGFKDTVTLDYDNKLVLNRNNDPYYKDYIVKLGDLRIRNAKKTEKLMKSCFEFFEGKLKKKGFEHGKDYAAYIQKVVSCLYFTEIIVSDELNAFKVFETLNARGVQLSSADLLKNYLFSLVDKESSHPERLNSLEEKWARLTSNNRSEHLPDFIRYYWNASHKTIRKNYVFKTIRDEIKTKEQVFSLLDDMLTYSDVYVALHDKNDEFWNEYDSDMKRLIGLLNLFGFKQSLSLLMISYLKLDKDEFKKLLKLVINICIRYNVICDKNPNDQEGPFNNLSIYISQNNCADYSLLNPIIINDDLFKEAFSRFSISYEKLSNTKKIRYLLGAIENVRGTIHSVDPFSEEATIEHIMPRHYENWEIEDEVGQRTVDKLGNMCLLEPDKNRKISDSAYEEKKKVYQTSIYGTTKRIPEFFPSWGEDEVERRQENMAKTATSVWTVKY